MQLTFSTLVACLGISTAVNAIALEPRQALTPNAARNQTVRVTLRSQCNEINRLTRLVDLSNNATRLAQFEKQQNFTVHPVDLDSGRIGAAVCELPKEFEEAMRP